MIRPRIHDQPMGGHRYDVKMKDRPIRMHPRRLIAATSVKSVPNASGTEPIVADR